MKREKALLGEAEGGGLRYDLRLAHTYAQEGERDGISQLIFKSFAVGCFAAWLFFSIFFIVQQSSQRFVRHRSGFFCAGMGMRDCVDWQVGSRHWWRILL